MSQYPLGACLPPLPSPSVPLALLAALASGCPVGPSDGFPVARSSDWDDPIELLDTWDGRVFDLADPADPVQVGREPLPLEADEAAHRSGEASSRVLGVAAAGDVIFSGNWTELATYRHHPAVRAPDVTAEPLVLQMPAGLPGEDVQRTLTVRNEGTEPLFLREIRLGDGALSVTGAPAGTVIAPGGVLRPSVVLTPPGSATFQGELTVVTDDPDQPEQRVVVTANVPGLGIGEPFPARSWVDDEGGTLDLADHAGEVVLLAYFATF